jgi:hypothetical protein
MKKQQYLRQPVNAYFWRTQNRKEIELVEDYLGRLYGFEVK